MLKRTKAFLTDMSLPDMVHSGSPCQVFSKDANPKNNRPWPRLLLKVGDHPRGEGWMGGSEPPPPSLPDARGGVLKRPRGSSL